MSNSYTTSTMWNAIERNVSGMPLTLDHLHKHLASALNDSQYWDENISPQQIKAELNDTFSGGSPIRPMKWLLASISKGRDVSIYYPDVIKLVGSPDLQVRKLVYTYMHQHCHDVAHQQLSLLSINSLQRGLDDPEPLIRAMALRSMAGLQLPDVVAIQVLAITKRIEDKSPYVRKCAVTAAAKIKHANLLPLVVRVLHHDTATMVLSSAMIAFYELTNHHHHPAGDGKNSGGDGDDDDAAAPPQQQQQRKTQKDYLAQLHPCYRKLCVLLTDMDEWGQVVTLEVLTHYCRHFFREPRAYRHGSAEWIDATRRVVRDPHDGSIVPVPQQQQQQHDAAAALPSSTTTTAPIIAPLQPAMLPPRRHQQRIIKRRIVKKGFYSDEEDQSTDEEVYADTMESVRHSSTVPLANSLREPDAAAAATMSFSSSGPNKNNNDDDMTAMIDKEEADLDEDHRRLLVAARPLLKSRNAGVVLAVCALQYYCGVSSVPIRKSLGKALVRIHYGRDAGETQYVVYASIRRLVRRCPSAFSPYLHDFFVLQMDPPQTRAAKLDILTSLALDPPSIETVLTELRQYLQWWHPQDDDEQEVEFVVAAVAAVGRVAELAQICYGRQGRGSEANVIVLNCLYGLVTVSLVVQDSRIVGQAVVVMYRILKLLQPGSNIVPDPNRVRAAATQRITLLLYNTLTRLCEVSDSERNEDDDDDDSDDDDDDDDDPEDVLKKWSNTTIVLPPSASAAAMLWMAEILVVDSNNNNYDCVLQNHLNIRREMARLLTRSFLDLEEVEKEQAMYFAFRLLQNADSSETERRLSERILCLGRVDPSTNIRDRARTFSNWAHVSVGLQFDREAFDEPSFPSRIDKDKMKTSSQGRTYYPSYLPFEKEDDYRFGSLSSLMGHKAHESYRPLPDWAAENSPASLREEPPPSVNGNAKDMLYRNEETSTDSSESQEYEDGSSSEDDEDDSSSDSDSDESFSDDDTDSDSSDDESGAGVKPNNGIAPSEGILLSPLVANNSTFGTLVDLSKGSGSENQSGKLLSFHPQAGIGVNSAATIINDLRGIVLEPSPASADEEPNDSRDFGEWFTIVRPEHSGGLSVRARYIRGQTKSRHAASIGLLAGSPSLVCMEFMFDNIKGVTPFRHVRIVQRIATATSSTIGPARVVAPPELPAVGVGENAKVVVSINFSGSSDRDGTLLAKLEVKFGSGGIPFEVRPSICDLLLPCTRTVAEFDGSIEKMHGFNRLETKVASTLLPQEVTSKLLGSSSLTPVKQSNGEGEKRIRLVGSLPASSDLVYVQLEQIGADYKMIICCVHALVLSPLLNQLKKTLTSQPDH